MLGEAGGGRVRPYYDDGRITLYVGDCRDVMPALEPVDLVLTDPPYNVGLAYDSHADSMAPADYRAWCADWFGACRAASKRQVVFPGLKYFDQWGVMAGEGAVPRWSATGCWYKPGNFAGGALGGDDWEPFLYWGKRVGGSSVFRASVGVQPEAAGHPCPKPLLLFRQLLARLKATSVLDPFVGSGTTLVAARYLGIPAVGIEISEEYAAIAAQRLQQGVLPLEAS